MPDQALFIQTLKEKLTQWNVQAENAQLERFYQFYLLLEETNRTMNLTAVCDEQGAAIRHFADSLNPFALNALKDAGRIVDIGTGGGFPGMPLALYFPEKQFVLLDSIQKKTDFLRRCVEELKLENVQVITARAEEFSRANRENFDAATTRAVAPLNVLLEVCLPALKVGGKFLGWKGKAIHEELTQAQHALQVLKADVTELNTYELTEEMSLFVVNIQKKSKTDPKYPRKTGIPSKKPL